MTEKERFWKKVQKVNECWYWMSAMGKGYGKTSKGKKTILAHRYAYELYKGKIPKGLSIDHLCRIKWCVNPAHLEAVTNKINVLRGIGITAQNAKKTHCKRGHLLDKIIYFKNQNKTGRGCSKCLAINVSNYRKRYPERVKVSKKKYELKKQLKF